jgi:glycerol uptake facilitator-like aquaporin
VTASDLPRRLAAELIGTALLVSTVVGSGIMAAKLAGGNIAVALLGNTIPTGAILMVLITVLGPISGAHLNPGVSLVMGIRGELRWKEFAPYIVAQVAGGIIGSIAATVRFRPEMVRRGRRRRLAVSRRVIRRDDNSNILEAWIDRAVTVV